MTEPTDKPVETTPRRSLWLRLIGWRRRPGRRLPYGPTKWGWVLILGFVGLIVMGGFAEYTMQPDFCRSCHIMEPYYQAWHASAHKDVPCADCHFEPGLANTLKGKWQASSQAVKYITGTFGSKPHAEVRDESCLREGCHERRILEGKVRWTAYRDRSAEAGSARKHETSVQKRLAPGGGRKDEITIRFDHAPHMQNEPRGMTLRCVSCHSQIVQGQHIVVTLDTCYLCHFKGRGLEHGRTEQNMTPAGCRACHADPAAEVQLPTGKFIHSEYADGKKVPCQKCHAETIKGDGSVPKQVCWNCHNIPAHISRYGETKFMHENHVTNHKIECSSCHVRIEHNLAAAAPRQVVAGGREHAVLECPAPCTAPRSTAPPATRKPNDPARPPRSSGRRSWPPSSAAPTATGPSTTARSPGSRRSWRRAWATPRRSMPASAAGSRRPSRRKTRLLSRPGEPSTTPPTTSASSSSGTACTTSTTPPPF
ncbi:MAG: NapC/NirT family cytochrome c [Planctomycetota bacterium]|nr:NapC/NirT family cytochrome c [Planctomycetota bacterium]